jgi:hypothetical protein
MARTGYYLAMERTDSTCDAPIFLSPNRRRAIAIARTIAKEPAWDCVALWVDDAEGNGIKKFDLPTRAA